MLPRGSKGQKPLRAADGAEAPGHAGAAAAGGRQGLRLSPAVVRLRVSLGQGGLHHLVQPLVALGGQVDAAAQIVLRQQDPRRVPEGGVQVHDPGVIAQGGVLRLELLDDSVDPVDVGGGENLGIVSVVISGVDGQNLAEVDHSIDN